MMVETVWPPTRRPDGLTGAMSGVLLGNCTVSAMVAQQPTRPTAACYRCRTEASERPVGCTEQRAEETACSEGTVWPLRLE